MGVMKMARKKTVEEKITSLNDEIKVIEGRIESDRQKLQQKKKAVKNLETESTMAVLEAYKLSASELRALLSKHASGEKNTPQHQEIKQSNHQGHQQKNNHSQ